MPKIIKIKQKKVENTGERSLVLSILSKSFASTNDSQLDEKQKEEQKKSVKISENATTMPGVWASFKQKLEIGGMEYALDAFEISLCDRANLIFKQYISKFLNKLIRLVESLPEEKTEEEHIGSRYVLIYEIFYRLAAVILSEEENRKRSVSMLFHVMQNFGKLLISDKTLVLDQKFSEFLYENHVKWMECFKDVIKIVQILNAPTRSFTQALNYFDAVEELTKAYIISYLTENLGKGKLSTNWIDDTFDETLRSIAQNLPALPFKSTQITSQFVLSQDQINIVANVNKHDPNKAKKLETLFFFLEETLISRNMVAAIDGLISIGNWVLLLRKEGFNIQILANYINSHGEKSRDILSFSESKTFLGSNTNLLIKTNTESGYSLASSAADICTNMQLLSASKSHHVIKQYAVEKIDALLVYQKQLGITVISYENLGLSYDRPSQLSTPHTFSLPSNTTVIEENLMERKMPGNPTPQSSAQLPSKNSSQSGSFFTNRPPAKNPKPETPPRKSVSSVVTHEDSSDSSSTLVSGSSSEKEGKFDVNHSAIPVKLMQNQPKVENYSSKPPSTWQSQKTKEEDVKQKAHFKQTPRFFSEEGYHSSSDVQIELPNLSTALSYGEVLDLPYTISTFSGFAQEEKQDFREAHGKLFNQQKQLGRQGEVPRNLNKIHNNFTLSFLEKFDCKSYFEGATDYCQRARSIILDFEQNYLERRMPSFRAYLWEQRHQELFCLKYLCVKAIENKTDAHLIIFIDGFLRNSETAIFSQYNQLKTDLEALEYNRIYTDDVSTSYPLDAPKHLTQINQQLQGEINTVKKQLQRQDAKHTWEIQRLETKHEQEMQRQAQEIQNLKEMIMPQGNTNPNPSPANAAPQKKPSSGVFSPGLGVTKK